MKIRVFDVETAPNMADVWGLWKQNIGINQLHNSGHIMCWAAKDIKDKEIVFMSEFHDGYENMIRGLHQMMEDSDVLVAHNGDGFDIRWANAEFVRMGLNPPDPSKTVDTLKTVRQRFYFPSYKLDYLAREFGLGKKIDHEGHELWTACLAGDKKAWEKMKKYNIHDIRLLQRLYYKIRPWIKNHPNHGLYDAKGRPTCSNCGSTKLHKKGLAYTARGVYQRYRCVDCGTPNRGTKMQMQVEERRDALQQEK